MIFLDISSNNHGGEMGQGTNDIDWNAVRGAGVDGVIVKATEGLGYTNSWFGHDYENAKAAGLKVGAYHFWHPEQDWSAQVHALWDHYTPAAGDFPPVWDSEINPTNRSWPDLANELNAILQANAGHYADAWGYWNRSWNQNLDRNGYQGGHGVWIATGNQGPTLRAIAQQFAPVPIPGIPGLTDWSVAA